MDTMYFVIFVTLVQNQINGVLGFHGLHAQLRADLEQNLEGVIALAPIALVKDLKLEHATYGLAVTAMETRSNLWDQDIAQLLASMVLQVCIILRKLMKAVDVPAKIKVAALAMRLWFLAVEAVTCMDRRASEIIDLLVGVVHLDHRPILAEAAGMLQQ